MKSSETPITILLPVYNGEKYLREAIESILNQTFIDFEFLIINDGSTDTSEEIILSFDDSRIRYIKNEQNLKLIATLNKGLEIANGKYIARMDADDISLPNRLEKQLQFMEENPEVGICGTYLRNIGKASNEVRFETIDEEIRYRLLFSTYLRHPTVMMRKSTIDDHQLLYEKEYIHVEDHQLWLRFAQVSKLAILPAILLNYRVHDSNISKVFQEKQAVIETKIRKEILSSFGVSNTAEDLICYNAFVAKLKQEKNPFLTIHSFDSLEELKRLLALITSLLLANREKKIVSPTILEKRFGQLLWKICTTSTHLGVDGLKIVFKNDVFRFYHPGKLAVLKFIFKSIFKKSYRS